MPRLVRMAAGLGSASIHPPIGTIDADFDLGDDAFVAPVVQVDATTPPGTSVEVAASRSSSNGVDWSDWTAPNGLTLTSPLARYWRVRLTLRSSSSQATPVVNSVALVTTGFHEPGWDWNGGGKWNV